MTIKKFDELYIKFDEGNQKSLNKAIAEAKRLGYKQCNLKDSMKLKGNGILRLGYDGEYFVSNLTLYKLIQVIYDIKQHKIPEEVKKDSSQELIESGVNELRFANMQIAFLINTIDEIEVLSKLENPGKLIEKVCSLTKERHNLDNTIHAKVLFNK